MALDIQSISAKIDNLSASLIEPELLKDKVYYAHTFDMINKLKSFLEIDGITDSELAIKFKSFLAETWDVINGTMLCYTVHPNSNLTDLTCNIANFVVDKLSTKQSPLAAINVLMPTVNLQSIQEQQFPHLGVYKDYAEQDVLPETLPGIKEILKTHILGYRGLYLIPVASILKETHPKGIANFYYDVLKFSEDYAKNCEFVSESELARLSNHSTLTRELFDSQQRYLNVTQKSCDLYQNLVQLTQNLYFYGATGAGKEDDAGNGVYAAIIAFNDYYQKLNTSNISSIPRDVKQAIDTLISLASDPTKNINATANLATCIASNRSNLLQAMYGKEALLRHIGQDDASRQQLIATTQNELAYAQQRLQAAILDHKANYQGSDSLPLTSKLFDRYKVQFNIRTLRDLDLFLTLSTNEVQNILKDDLSLQQEVISTIDNLEHLVIMAVELPEEKFYALVDVLKDRIKDEFITNSIDLRAFLISLPPHKYHNLLSLLQIPQSNIIPTVQVFRDFISFFPQERQIVLFDFFKNHLSNMIETAVDLIIVLKCLVPEQRVVIYEMIKDRVFNIINTSSEFQFLAGYFTPEQRYVIFEHLKPKIASIINSGNDYKSLIFYLGQEQRTYVLQYFSEHITDIIKGPGDFRNFLGEISAEQTLIILDSFKENLSKIINTCENFAIFFKDLPKIARSTALHYLLDDLIGKVTSAVNFRKVLEHLNVEERQLVFENLKPELNSFFNTNADISYILEFLTESQRIEAFNILKNKFKEKIAKHEIKNAYGLTDLLRYLPTEARLAVLQDCREILPSLIRNGYDFNVIFITLSEPECEYIAEIFNHDFSPLFFSANNFKHCLNYLSPAKCRLVAENFTIGFKNALMKSNVEFYDLLNQYSPEYFPGVFEGFKSKISEIVTNVQEFAIVIACVPEHKRSEILTALEHHLTNIFITEADLAKIPKSLSTQQQQFIFDHLNLAPSEMLKYNSGYLRCYTQASSGYMIPKDSNSTLPPATKKL